MKSKSIFISILNTLKNYAEAIPKAKASKNNFNPRYKQANNSSYNQFENLISWSLQKIWKPEWKNNGITYTLNFGHYFPDINIDVGSDKYGLELKSRKSKGWTINGGSVFESISKEDYSDIYVFFGDTSTKSTNYRIQYMPYWEAIDTIRVTHSPRYHLSMNPKRHIFNSWAQYSAIRQRSKSSKAKWVQKKLRALANKPQWYIGNSDNSSSTPPIPLSSVRKPQRSQDIAETMVLYPQDLLKTESNYWNLTNYLLSEYNIYSSNIRDSFSSGGKYRVNGIRFPKIVKTMKEHAKYIKNVINFQSKSFYKKAYSTWPKLLNLSKTSNDPKVFLQDYKKVLDYLGNKFISKELTKAHVNKLSKIIF